MMMMMIIANDDECVHLQICFLEIVCVLSINRNASTFINSDINISHFVWRLVPIQKCSQVTRLNSGG